ncbi:MAG: DNA/RNA helicase domain-containing protein [Cytophagales bacterium]
MTSFRKTIETVFRITPGLKGSMVISPSDTFALNEKYDLLIVDEAHRLRQYKNISWRGVFKQNNKKLGLDDSGTELDWIIANSKNQIFFYDSSQSVKPSDIDRKQFDDLLDNPQTLKLELTSQMRVKGGNDYITFVDKLLHANLATKKTYHSKDYELHLFDSLVDLYDELEKKEKSFGLCRLIAGYSWPWLSKVDETATDIEIDGLKFQWNQTDKDWINSTNAFKEIGCIHTTQGYELNYTGLIFGKEINYNKLTKRIEVNPEMYFDTYGRIGADNEELRLYIINIYKTIMYRGIRGTFIYACNKDLRDYLRQFIGTLKKEIPFRILQFDDVRPYINSVPLMDISAAAGSFSDFQMHSELEWIELPFNVSTKKDYFVCKVVGDSMNKKIPNDSYCLFKKYEGGSKNGEIVLVELYDKQLWEMGSRYTVKEYHSTKRTEGGSWRHDAITLKPLSYNSEYKSIELVEDDANTYQVIGIFDRVLV